MIQKNLKNTRREALQSTIKLLVGIMFIVFFVGFINSEPLINFDLGDGEYSRVWAGTAGSDNHAQTFTLYNGDGVISYIEVKIGQDGNEGTLYGGIFETFTDGKPKLVSPIALFTNVTQGTISADTVTGEWYNLTFAGTPTLTNGSTYALILMGTGGSDANQYGWRVNNTGGYTRGARYGGASNNWTLTTTDTMFRVWGTLLTNEYAVNLISPANDTAISTTGENFIAHFNITGDMAIDHEWKNATYRIWRNGVSFNTTSVTLSGNNTNYSLFVDDFTIGNYIWNVQAYHGNLTYNNITASSNYTFTVGSSINSTTYNTQTYETARETFSAVINILEGSELSLVKLFYNGTEYAVSNVTITGTGDSVKATLFRQIDIPLNVNPLGNQTNDFYWQLTYDGGTVQTFETLQQNSSYINLRICDNPDWTIAALNFTLLDEENQTTINATLNPVTFLSTFKYWLGSGDVYKNYSYQTLNNGINSTFAFCIYPYYPNNYTFKADLDNKFFASSFSENEYYLRNATLTNVTADFDLYLYLLNSSLSTKFYITAKQGITAIDDALVTISKFFIGEGIYKTVSIKLTDDAGEFPFFADLDGKYRFSIVKDGVLLGVIDKTASCAASPCEFEINIQEDIGTIFESYGETYASGVLSNLSFNSTSKIVTYTFIDTTGLANYFRLQVSRGMLNDTISASVCDTTSYSSSGTLTCNLTGYDGDFSAVGYISRSPEKIDKILSFLISNAVLELGYVGLLLNFAIILTVVVASAALSRGNPSTIIFSLGFVILLLKLITIFPFSWTVVVSLEFIIAIILYKVKT